MNGLWDIRIFLGLVPKESLCTSRLLCKSWRRDMKFYHRGSSPPLADPTNNMWLAARVVPCISLLQVLPFCNTSHDYNPHTFVWQIDKFVIAASAYSKKQRLSWKRNICLAGQEPRSLQWNGDFISEFTTARHWAYSKQRDSGLKLRL